MARKLVGILQILLKQDVTARAPEINRALASIQGAASRLGNAPWGAAFDRQLQRLKLSPAERAAIAGSYGLLARDISGKIAKTDLATWRHGVLGHFTAVRAGMDEATKSAKRFHTTMGKMARLGLVTFGGVGGLYLAGRALHSGATAASEEWRQKAEARYSGLPEEERDQLWNQAVKLAGERRLNTSLVFQSLREAALAMETTTDAIAVSDQMSQALLYLSNTLGADGAVNGIRSFNKAMDNIDHITPDEYLRALEAYVKAQQLTGADMDPEAFAQAIKYSRSAGKIFSDEYLFQWLPFKIAEVGGSDAGTQLRAFSDNTIGGTATKEVKGYQAQIGVRNADGTMAWGDELLQNPEKWINERLVPALEKAGVDTSDNVQLAQVLNSVASNRLARDFVMSAITNWDQHQRLFKNLPRTAGLSAADDIQDVNPFATLDGLASSLENLSGAAGNHIFPVIIPAMNSLADTINSISAKIREMPAAAFGLGLAGLGLGGIGAWKIGAGIIGLATAGPSLQTAAVMLQGAATSLGGTGAGGAAGTAKKGGNILSNLGQAVGLAALAEFAQSQGVLKMPDGEKSWDRNAVDFLDPGLGRLLYGERDTLFSAPEFTAPAPSGGMENSPMNTGIFPDDLDALETKATATGAALGTLNGSVAPQVDTASLEAAMAVVNQLSAALQRLGGYTRAAGAKVQSEINATYSDMGVAP